MKNTIHYSWSITLDQFSILKKFKIFKVQLQYLLHKANPCLSFIFLAVYFFYKFYFVFTIITKRKKNFLLWARFFDTHLYGCVLWLNLLLLSSCSDLSAFATIILESTILRWSRTIKARSTLNSQMVTYLSINRV